MTKPHGFEMKGQTDFYLSYEFDKEAFIRFMMLQSNVNVQISEKGRSVDEIRILKLLGCSSPATSTSEKKRKC